MKEKKHKVENRQETLFYFEAIGFLLLIFCAVIIAKLGTLGFYLTIFFKILFGDWYLLFVFILLIIGLSNILNHKSFDYYNQRFIGYLICSIGLLMLAHFPVHNYVVSIEGDLEIKSYLTNTINYYKNFALNSNNTVLGGGIIGGLLFFVFFLLLGKIGVILVSLIIVGLGITMLVNKSIKEIILDFAHGFKKVGGLSKNFNNFFKYEIGKKESRRKEFDILKKLNLNDFKEIDKEEQINYLELEKTAIEYKNIIKDLFRKLNIDYKENEYHLMYSFTYFSYIVYSSFDCKTIGENLTSIIKEEVYIYRNTNNLYIEIENKNIYAFSAYNILSKQSVLKNNFLIPIAYYFDDEILEIDVSFNGSFLISGDRNSGVKNFVAYYIYSHYIKMDPSLYEFYLYDRDKEFVNYKKIFKETFNSDINSIISIIQNNIDSRYMLFRERHVKTIDEYNYSFNSNDERAKNSLKRLNYILYFNDNYENKDIEDKIIYFIQACKDVGINIILISRNLENFSTILISSFEKRIIFSLKKKEMSKLALDSSYACVLKYPGEAIYYKNGLKRRVQCPKLLVDIEN